MDLGRYGERVHTEGLFQPASVTENQLLLAPMELGEFLRILGERRTFRPCSSLDLGLRRRRAPTLATRSPTPNVQVPKYLAALSTAASLHEHVEKL